MACPEKNCDLTAVTATLSGSGGTHVFTEYVETGDLITFGSTEFESTAQYSNTRKKSRFSGQTIPEMEITLNTFPCDEVFEGLYQLHINNANLCFTLVVNDPCCNVRRFTDVRITSMTPPSITSDTTLGSIVFRGTPVQ